MKQNGPLSKYKPEFCDLFKEMLLRGESTLHLAIHAGVTQQTVLEWIRRYPELDKVYRENRKAKQ